MIYLGSKDKISRKIVKFITANLNAGGTYIEPFCGGCNVAKNLPQLTYKVKLYDYNKYLIALLKKCQEGYIPPITPPTKEQWEYQRKIIDENPSLSGEYGYLLGFRGCFYWGYCYLDKKTGYNYYLAKRTSLLNTVSKIKEAEIHCQSYEKLELPEDKENTLIYCDIPYQTSRKNDAYNRLNKTIFSHYEYWNWVRELSNKGYKVVTSELTAPDDFISVLDINHKHSVSGKNTNVTEKLFVLKGTEERYKKIKIGITFE